MREYVYGRQDRRATSKVGRPGRIQKVAQHFRVQVLQGLGLRASVYGLKCFGFSGFTG